MTTTTQTESAKPVAGPNERIDLLEKKGLFSALWLFVLLNLIFRDLHEIVKAEFLEQALTGTVNGQMVSEALFLIGGIIVEVPIMMVLMSWALPQRANRWANLITAPLFAVLTILSDRNDLDDYFHSGLEIIALFVITWLAWRWKGTASKQGDLQT